MSLILPRLGSRVGPIVDAQGRPTQAFTKFWEAFAKAIETQEAAQDSAIEAIAAAQAAADAANAAAADAQAAAETADAAATSAQTVADAVDASASLNASYTTGLTISATDAGTDATITISAHTRIYGNGTSVSVSGGSVTALSYSTTYWLYYDDAARAGGSVTYHATTTDVDAFVSPTNPDRHFVGAVQTPASGAGATTGAPIRPPGYSSI
ncbi:MAG: hypothetical protein ACM3YN_08400 [Parcubacteria group bacterium]